MSIESLRKWRAANPEKARVLSAKNLAKRRAYLKQHGNGKALTAIEWSSIKDYFGHVCAYCLQPANFTQDHVLAVSKGGSSNPENIIPACRSCNSRKGNRGILTMLKRAA